MKSVSTIALLTKKGDISSDLFGAYWRDVHGILAARIPGFNAYIQYHLGPALQKTLALPKGVSTTISKNARFHGIAEVTFDSEEDRNGLGSSEAAAHIQGDEQYVFKTSLLYNLKAGSSKSYVSKVSDHPDAQFSIKENGTVFLLVARRKGITPADLQERLESTLIKELSKEVRVLELKMHSLASGDPSLWNTPGVENDQNSTNSIDAVIQLTVEGHDRVLEILNKILLRIPGDLYKALRSVHAYKVRGRYQMVKGGRPTHLGLRGLDVMRTIDAAGAANQRSEPVVQTIYGITPAN